MIYNLTEYLQIALPTITFVVDGWIKESPEQSVLLIQNGGTSEHQYDRQEWLVQFLARAKESVAARQDIMTVYDELRNRFRLPLPQVTIDSVDYPALIAWQISPNQLPGYIGADKQNLQMWSHNVTVTTT